MHQVLADHGLAQTLVGDEDHVLRFANEIQGEGAIHGRPMDLFGPGPLVVGDRLEPTEAGGAQSALQASAPAVLEFRVRERFEEDGRGPAFLHRVGEEIVEGLGGVGEAEPLQVSGQGRRRSRVG